MIVLKNQYTYIQSTYSLRILRRERIGYFYISQGQFIYRRSILPTGTILRDWETI